MVKLAPLTARTRLGSCPKVTQRSSMTRSGAASSIASALDLARVEGVAHRLADEVEQGQHGRQHEEAGEAQPRRLQVVLALVQQLAKRGGAGRQAESEEVERGQHGDRAAQGEGQKGEGG